MNAVFVRATLVRIYLRTGAVLLCSCLGSAAIAEVEFLDQNWNEADRQFSYTTSQGSRLMPYDWFLALEEPLSQKLFCRTRVLELGFLANDNPDNNPDTLPVGFVLDTDWSGKRHVGLNCSACHTNQISYGGKTWQIDGAPALADLWSLLVELGDALNATREDPVKFTRFAARVLGDAGGSAEAVAQLKAEVDEFRKYWNQFIADSSYEDTWGRARLDAFGMIFNRVSSINLEIPENSQKPNAPVSVPFLWGTSWHNRVQWIGSAPNTNDIERLGRNVGEVLGVFAEADLKRATFLRHYYRTSARRLNQLRLENRLKQLWSPKWPEATLGSIDPVKREAGRVLFQKNCVSCHQVVPHGQQKTPVEVAMTPLAEVGTDPTTALNAALSVSVTGRLEGSRIPGSDPLPAKVSTGVLLKNVVRGSIISPFRDVALSTSIVDRLRDDIRGLKSSLELSDAEVQAFFDEMDVSPQDIEKLMGDFEQKQDTYFLRLNSSVKRDVDKIIGGKSSLLNRFTDRKATALSLMTQEEAVAADSHELAYKGRPLDGIWATAPYLHNGSVPNLYDLLSPVEERTQKFHVGSSEFDPVRVGFSTAQVTGTTTEFDVSLPGNSNAGHDTYGQFSPAERWQLVEYMKSL